MAPWAVLIFILAYGNWALPVGGQGGQQWGGYQNSQRGGSTSFSFQNKPWFESSSDDPWKSSQAQDTKPSQKNYSPPPWKAPEEKKDPQEGGGIQGEVAQQLNQEVRGAWVSGAARILVKSDDVEALARGLTFPGEERSRFLRKTGDRRRDGDVVTLKAIAKAALMGQDPWRLAKVMIEATSQPGYGDWLEKQDQQWLEKELMEILSDKKLMFKIVSANPAKEFLPPGGRRRKLTCDACTPANSWVCAHCWPSVACKPFFWCRF